jgi:hypothetical protein
MRWHVGGEIKLRKGASSETTVKLPVVDTALASYRFLIDHPYDAVRVGWLPLALLYALNLIFGTFEPMPDFSDPEAAMSRIAPLLGSTVVNVLIQSAVAAMTLVVWHRLVMQGYNVGDQTVPMRVTLDEAKYLGRWMLISLLFIGILFAVDIAIVLSAFLVMLAIQLVSILVMGGTGLALGEQAGQLTLIGQIGMAPATIAAIYLTTRLSLVLPATATGKEARFERAWYISRGNGARMVAASLIVMAPLQFVIWGLMKVTAYMSDTILYYPLALMASAAFLLFILATGTVLSLFSLGLDREPVEEKTE